MDLPFAGQAVKELKKEGRWDEDAGKPLKQYIVTYEECTCVNARSEDEARNTLAHKSVTCVEEVK